MKVILSHDVKELGKAGALVNVSEGYARNFLLPRKLAIIADSGAIGELDKKQKQLEQKAATALADAKAIADKIKDAKVVIKAKVGAGSKLYGSVTNGEIAEALAKQHDIKVDKRNISMSAIKSLGTFDVPVKLHQDVVSNIHIVVEPIEA